MKLRIISALVMLLIFVPLLLTGGMPFAMLMLIISLIGLHELFKVKRKQKEVPVLIEMFGYLIGGFLTLNNCTSSNLVVDMDYRIAAFMIFAFILPISSSKDLVAEFVQ